MLLNCRGGILKMYSKFPPKLFLVGHAAKQNFGDQIKCLHPLSAFSSVNKLMYSEVI
jgi:hypothetical protein